MEDKINIQFPAKSNYISAIRLAVSAIAEQMNFNVTEIDDLKSCVAEACILFLCGEYCESISIEITIKDKIHVLVEGMLRNEAACKGLCGEEFSSEISKIIIQSLSDEANIHEEDGILKRISFSKKAEG